MAGTSPAMTENDMEISDQPICFFLERSDEAVLAMTT
jgi:hypothetical protein